MTPSKHKGFVLKLDESLFSKVDALIRYKNYKQNEDLTKQQFITDAIKAKLSQEHNLPPPPARRKRCINYKIDRELSAQLEMRIAELKQSDSSYTIKRWIEEAISSYLEKEASP